MGRTNDTAGVRAVRVLSRLGILFGTARVTPMCRIGYPDRGILRLVRG
jgi:hypothetical protein